MDISVQYEFRGGLHKADVYFSFERQPCYLFITLKSEDLILEFGEDLPI